MRDVEALFTKKETFRDFDIRFMRNPVNGDLVSLDTIGSIKQSVKLLLMTTFYERPFQPKIGTRLRASLFELYDLDLVSEVQGEIARVLASFEPRVVIKTIDVGSSERNLDANTLNIHLTYLIEGRTLLIDQVINLQRVR